MKYIKSIITITFFITSICNAQFSFDNYALHNLNVIDVNSKKILKGYTIVIHNDLIVDILPTKNFIENDSHYAGKTALFVTYDHGRHSNGILDGYSGHGDDCLGCRKISLLALGPDFRKNVTVENSHTQLDISVTIAKVMKFNMPTSEGVLLEELFQSNEHFVTA